MKARNAAEKQILEVQNQYASFRVTCTSEAEQLHLDNENLKMNYEKLQKSLHDLEEELVNIKLEKELQQKDMTEKAHLIGELETALSIKNAEINDKKDLLMNLLNEVTLYLFSFSF